MFGFIANAITGNRAADDAANAQRGAANTSNDMLWRAEQENQAALKPWQEAGTNALGQMGSADFQRDFTANDFQADPGYAFRMAEGQKALERSAAARGGLMGGGFAKGLAKYSQGVASDEFQNAYNRFNSDRDRRFGRLGQIAGMGVGARDQGIASRTGFAHSYGDNMMAGANAYANGQVAKAKNWETAVNGIQDMAMSAAGMGGLGKMGGGGNSIPRQGSGGGSGFLWSKPDYSQADGMGGGIQRGKFLGIF
jgi:hypothetical protein